MIKPGKWYKSSDGLFFVIATNVEDKRSTSPELFLTAWVIDGTYIPTDGIFRSIPEEGVQEAPNRDIWRAMDEVHNNLVEYQEKFLQVSHYVSTVQYALQFSNIKSKNKANVS